MEQYPLAQGDWAKEWIKRQKARKKPDNVEQWDKRAKDFGTSKPHSYYTDMFYEYMQARPGETILDIGSGPGTLAIPFARKGHGVFALDFSSAMLEKISERAPELVVPLDMNHVQEPKVSTIVPIHASWDDDWSAYGVVPCDLVIASRSTMVDDLKGAIEKLSAYAKRKVCMTLVANRSPKNDERLMQAIGREKTFGYDYIYGVNILYQMGIWGELRFIFTTREDHYHTKAAAFEDARNTVGAMTPDEEKRLVAFLNEHLVRVEDEAQGVYWKKDYPHKVAWAFLSWDVANTSERL